MSVGRKCEQGLPDEDDTLPPYDEITQTDPDCHRPPTSPIPRRRDVHVLDFKDGRSAATVTHGPLDPSRLWVTIENQEAYLQLSFEEGIARKLLERLLVVLATFGEVRSALDHRGGLR
jgi:hypothetical protein